MSKSRRLLEILLTLQTRRRFTAAELAAELGVSRRTALRYLHQLSEAGVPLASRPGPDGGYLVVRDGTLPPLSFTIDQAVSLFFSYQSLRNYGTLPFDAQVESALQKLYQHLPVEAKRRVDRMTERLEFAALHTDVATPHLAALLDAAIDQKVLAILYQGADGVTRREIQPIGVYAQNGLWYCPAYCFTRQAIRIFRIDRVQQVEAGGARQAPDDGIAALTLKDYRERIRQDASTMHLEVVLSPEGVRQMGQPGRIEPDGAGGGILRMEIETGDLIYFARLFLGMGQDACVLAPGAMLEEIRRLVEVQCSVYGLPRSQRSPEGAHRSTLIDSLAQ